MSFIDSLKNGEIPEKKKNEKALTSYDKFINEKTLKLKEKSKNIELIKPKSFNETEHLIDILKDNKGIVVDFSATKQPDSQRMLDFLSGAVYALGGEVERIEQNLYLMTPKGVSILNKL